MRKLKHGDIVWCKSLDEYTQLKELCERDGVSVNMSNPQVYGEETCYEVISTANGYSKKSNFTHIDKKICTVSDFTNCDLSFLEVMQNIKEGETWTCTKDYYDIKSIELQGGYILINKKNDGKKLTVGSEIRFSSYVEYITFAEAFEKYNDGQTIMSESGTKYKKHSKLKIMFNEDEINGKWVIIDE